MKVINRSQTGILVILISLFFTAGFGMAAEQPVALKGVKNADAIFDIRTAKAKTAKIYLGLIKDSYKGKTLKAVDKDFKFSVVFIGPAVKLISTNQKDFSAEDKKHLVEIAKLIKEMSKEGVNFEICLFAAKLFKVDPKTILPEIKHEENGVYSLIGYQSQGYSLVPLY